LFQISYIEDESQLKEVLELCYDILGQHLRDSEYYRYDDWKERIGTYSKVLVYAHENGKIIAAVLGRPENDKSLVMGFTACNNAFRMKGITKELVKQFEHNAKELAFKYITLGADSKAEEFYEKCGYKAITEMHGQKIYQKLL
jgi:predicted GNAT family N-acyltransferase